MAPDALTRERIAISERFSDLSQQADQVLFEVWPEIVDNISDVWSQVGMVLRRSLERSGFRQPALLIREPPPWRPMNAVVVAPGIMVWAEEYEQRFAGIELDELRKRMSPDLFKVFVRYIGSIPGHPNLDVVEIATAPEEA